MKKFVLLAVVLLAFVGAILWFKEPVSPVSSSADTKNLMYEIDGQRVTLVNGYAEVIISDDSASKGIVRYFGNAVQGDFDADGLVDEAFLLTQNNGGSGTFFSLALALALRTLEGLRGSNAIFLGDRIAPQTTEFRNGEIIVNYADRKAGEPMTASPSVGVSRYFRVVDGRLTEVKK